MSQAARRRRPFEAWELGNAGKRKSPGQKADHNQSENIMNTNSSLKLQNHALAVRRELGFPLYGTANQSAKFTAAGVADIARGLELSVMARDMSRDLVYFGWASLQDEQPVSIALAFREEHFVDWIDGCTLWAADHEVPLILVDEIGKQHFVRAARGAFERREGLPAKKLAAGKRLAMRRVRRTLAAMPWEVASDNVWMPRGASWADYEPQPKDGTCIRFS